MNICYPAIPRFIIPQSHDQYFYKLCCLVSSAMFTPINEVSLSNDNSTSSQSTLLTIA